MKHLTDQQVAEYFHRSFTAVDGLWFMKVEEKHGFDAALEIDNEVWKVLPKVQARKMKSLLNATRDIDGLYECFTTRFQLEGFGFETQKDAQGFSIIVKSCPWHNQMIKSGREHLSGKIGSTICRTDYAAWAKEFGNIDFELQDQICTGAGQCILRFSQAQETS
ncbi:MAG: DUF6125 family protein [Verrucomicrobiia bacterium]|jgi:hypothetical protein